MSKVLDLPSADVYVIGSGPNGLAAAIVMAQAGCKVVVLEAESIIGGGARSAELTLPGFIHDVGSAVHPLGIASPFFRVLPLERHGLEWIQPELPFAHPLDRGTAVTQRSLRNTAADLGIDGPLYERLIEAVLPYWNLLDLASALPPFAALPKLAYFGLQAIRSADTLIRKFKTTDARAMLAGAAAHGNQPLTHAATSGIALVLAVLAHAVGWPIPRGGAQKITDALAAYLRTIGGEIIVNTRVESLDQLPPSGAVLCDITPLQLLQIAATRMPAAYRQKLERFRYGPGVFKMDWALSAPIPWRDQLCARAGTVHIGGTFEEIAASEQAVAQGRVHERPYVILAQPSLFDPLRAPTGQHTAWGYCHVPNGCDVDMTDRIEEQIERFAPGFRKTVVARSTHSPRRLEQENANLIGGDISGGSMQLSQVLFRPTRRLYRTPLRGLYLCSSSTPPGPGVHGMCGYFAACAALKDLF